MDNFLFLIAFICLFLNSRKKEQQKKMSLRFALPYCFIYIIRKNHQVQYDEDVHLHVLYRSLHRSDKIYHLVRK